MTMRRGLWPQFRNLYLPYLTAIFTAGLWLIVLLALSFMMAAAQDTPRQTKKFGEEPEIHNTIVLPPTARQIGSSAGSFVDPVTGNKVYRLSDRALCPKGATHFYSYSNQFSARGLLVFDCLRPNAVVHPVYDQDFRLRWADVAAAARYVDSYGTPQPLVMVQWSQEREVLFGEAGLKIVELDPFGGKNRIFADFSVIKEVVRSSDGARIPVRTANELSVGPGERLMVHLRCRKPDPQCPKDWDVVGIGVYDPATGKYAAMYVPVPGDRAPTGFDEGQWSQNPQGRLIVVYEDAPNFSYSADLSSRVQFDDNHGHRGFFCGSNGRCYAVRQISDRLPRGGVGQIGCRKSNGELDLPWKQESALYDDETGKRVLVFGCDLPGQAPWQHFSRSPGGKDVFGISSLRFTFKPSLERLFPTDEAILRAKVEYAEGQPASVHIDPVAYHRSAEGPRAKLMGRECGYWAQPRMVMDFTGTRFMFDSTMSHPEWPAMEDGLSKLDCVTDVYVAVYEQK